MKVEIEKETRTAICLEIDTESFIVVFGETEQKGKEIAETIKKALENKK